MKKFKFVIDGHKYEVAVNEVENNIATVDVNGTPFTVEIEREEKELPIAPVRRAQSSQAAPRAVVTGSSIVKSPLPGSIVKVLVSAGQSVKRGDVLLTMESMKMENNITAENDGVVKTVFVQPAQSVMQDDKLVEMEVASAAVPAAAPVQVAPAAPAPKAAPAPAPAPKPAAPAGGIQVKSPLPGSVVRLVAKVGDSVKRGDVLLTLESMKMENNIMAEQDGVVKAFAVKEGQSVMQDDLLVTME